MIFASIVEIITIKRKYWRARSHMRCYFVHATNISHACHRMSPCYKSHKKYTNI